MYGVNHLDEDLLHDAWDMGFIYFGGVSYDSCRYVADYVQKKLYGPEKNNGPYAVMSQGIGKQFALDNKKQLCDNLYVLAGGVKHGLPKYYAKTLDVPGDSLKEAAQQRRDEIADHYQNKYGEGGDYGIAGYIPSSTKAQIAAGKELRS